MAGPKALLPIGKRLLIDHLLDRLPRSVTAVCVVQGPDRAVSTELDEVRGGKRIEYVVQPTPLGVGDAVLRGLKLVSGPTLVAMGDVYYEDALGPYVHSLLQATGGVLVERTEAGSSAPVGLVQLDGDRVTRIYKTPFADQTEHRVCGLFLLPEAAREVELESPWPATGEFELEQVVQILIDRGLPFQAVKYTGWRKNINTVTDLRAVERRAAHLLGERAP